MKERLACFFFEVYPDLFIIACLALFFSPACDTKPTPLRTHVGDWRDEVIYHLLTDRFANGDTSNDTIDGVGPIPGDFSRFMGGDFRGIEEHLDYIQGLGATTIWISPIVKNVQRMEVADGYHAYWGSDFTQIEPHFGSEEDLRRLVKSVHARGMHILIDVVVNHAGRVFFYDLNRNGVEDPGEAEPPYRREGYDVPIVFTHEARLFSPIPSEHHGDINWEINAEPFDLTAAFFHLRGRGELHIPEQRRYGDFPDGLRDFRTEDSATIEALVQTWVTWVARTDVDGFRLDAVPHAEVAFWRAFGRKLRERLSRLGKNRFFLLGEIFEYDPREMVPYLSMDALDGGFDIPLKHALIDRVIGGGAAPSEALWVLEGARHLFRETPQPLGIGLSPWQARVAIVDNHDTGRFFAFVRDPFALDLALFVIFTIDAIPCIYYGTEQELAGGGGHEGREPLWLRGHQKDTPTYRWIAQLAALRRLHPALRYGELKVRYASTHPARGPDGAPSQGMPDAGLLVYERIFDGEKLLCAINTHPTQSSTAQVATSLREGTYVELIEGEDVLRVDANGNATLIVPPRRARLYARSP
ncbi:MAG: alpha-amylase family glycosyl hydrolase [Sandaracinaceae bacterium]|nr:alpha-amylase family glycosyl hydrolase [Sandaracinaceae bacterium]